MGSILKRLFQGDIIFPQSPEQEKDFSDLADDIQKKRRHMETSLGPEEAQAAVASRKPFS